MEELTNDIGEFVNPHTANILISEFKKFFFLVDMNIKELTRQEKSPSLNMFADDTSKKSFYSLTAPPLIDVVWRLLIRREIVYENF